MPARVAGLAIARLVAWQGLELRHWWSFVAVADALREVNRL